MLDYQRKGLIYGLSIGFIGFLLANLVFATLISGLDIKQFIEGLFLFATEGTPWVYPLALFILLTSGSIIGPFIGRWVHVNGWRPHAACMLGSFLLLALSSLFTGIAIFISEQFGSNPNSAEIEVILMVSLFIVVFGTIPALITGSLYGRYIALQNPENMEAPQPESAEILDDLEF